VEPTPLVAVLDGVYRWSVWNEPRKLWFNSYRLRVGDVEVVVDPLPMSADIERALSPSPPTICVITNRDHQRAAAALRVKFGARLLVPRSDADAIDLFHDGVLDDGDIVADELRVVAVAGGKTPGELALFWPARRMLIIGDAAIGRPAGSLSMLPDDKFADIAAARAGVAALAALDPEIILVGDGDSLLTGGAAALAALGHGPAKAPAPGVGGC
jgi:glyoxylase-like metal-dependent hydrolase (beta-lactamase superfamily II)